MSSRQERFNQKKKGMQNALHGSSSESVVEEVEKPSKAQERMENALLDLKLNAEDYCQTMNELAEEEIQSDKKIQNFTDGRSSFELFLWNWVMGDKWMIWTYVVLTLLIPVGLIWWKEENQACGVFMFLFIGMISWIFIHLLVPFISAFIEGLANNNIVWYQVRMKSYHPLGSSVIGVLNFVNWFFAKGSFLVVLVISLCASFHFDVESYRRLIPFSFSMFASAFAMFLLSYLWRAIYYVIAHITLGLIGWKGKYRLVYLWNKNNTFEKSF